MELLGRDLLWDARIFEFAFISCYK